MASVFSTATALSYASINIIPNPSVVNSLFINKFPNLIQHLVIADAESSFRVNTLWKLKPYDPAAVHCFQQNKPLVGRLSSVVARASVGGDNENIPDAEDEVDGVVHSEQDVNGLLPDSESLIDGIEIKIEKIGNNSRKIRSKVAVQASLQTVWDILTDYERLADFIPGLAVSQLLDKRENFARLFQVGQQNLAFGLKFNAKGTVDCFEKDLQTLPHGKRRDIEFKMVEGDFQLFEGRWSIEEGKKNAGDIQNDPAIAQAYQTSLFYIVHVKPKLWLPVRLIEGRLCNEIRSNLSCIREEAEKAARGLHSTVQ